MVNLFWLGSGSLFSPGISGMNAAISACKKGSNWLLATNFLRSAMQFSKTRNAVPHARISIGEELMIEYNYLYMCKCPSCVFGSFGSRSWSFMPGWRFQYHRKVRQPTQMHLYFPCGTVWKMLGRSFDGDVVSYGTAISACEKCGMWESALVLAQEMQARYLLMSLYVCSCSCRRHCVDSIYTHHCTSPVTPIGSHVCLWGRPHLIGLGECFGWLKSGLEQQSPGDYGFEVTMPPWVPAKKARHGNMH